MTGITLYESMPSMKTGKCSTIIDGNLIDDEYYPIVYENGEVLIASEIVRKYFDDSILRNDNFIITIKDGNYVRFEAGSKKIVVNDRIKKSKVAAQLEGDEIYLPCDVLAKLYTLEYRFIDETNVLIIDTDKSERFSCMTHASDNLKIDGKVSGTVQAGESVTSYKTTGDETLIVTSLGACGFVKSSNLEKVSELKLESKLEELTSGMTLGILSVNLNGDDDKVVLKKNKKNILWYQVTSKKANPKGDEIVFPESVNTICFT
ncbi:MAG: copper amine oxidase N-terminal domain-containing protein [Clostridia bacterium]|nr:copper amine oxidase N-terminal domain-containing protein [Clostridia bacterium]